MTTVAKPGTPAPSRRHPEAEDGTCGIPVSAKVRGKDARTSRPCALAPGHEKDHSPRRPPQKIQTEGLKLDLDVMDSTDVVLKVTNTQRSDMQVKVDAMVRDAHTAWVAAGKPRTFKEVHKARAARRFRLGSKSESEKGARGYTKLLQSAGDHLGVKLRILPVQPIVINGESTGEYQLPWFAMDKTPKTTPPKTTQGAQSVAK